MKARSFCVLLFGIGLGCAGMAHAATVKGPGKSASSSPYDGPPPVDPANPVVRWRRVALKTDPTKACPVVSGWKDLDENGVADPLLTEAGLDRYCEYQYLGTDGHADFPSVPGLTTAQSDRIVVAASAAIPKLEIETKKVLAAQFLSQAGKGGIDLRKPGPPAVRLVFLDTQRTQEGVPSHPSGPSWHGYSLANLAQQLLCVDKDHCGVELATRLALPLKGFPEVFSTDRPPTEPTENGGEIGLLGDLADAIRDEVRTWRQCEKPRPRHLILNLSLGWDGELYGGLDFGGSQPLDLPARRVYDALLYARKSGALVIAAAGNRRGGNSASQWPLLPAAWELRRPAGAGLSLALPFSPRLVYAVGGVESQGLPIANTRQNAMPQRVVYSDHAVAAIAAPAPGQEPWTHIYTGTSVSAAVTSAIAAAVWTLRPELQPQKLMGRLLDSGNPLPIRADFYPWKGWRRAPHLRRISLCAAVTRACQGSRACPLFPPCLPWDGKAPVLPDDPVTPPMVSLTPGGRSFTAELLDAASEPVVAPQPEDDPCNRCSLKPPGATSSSIVSTKPSSGSLPMVIDIAIDPLWPATLFSSATLDLQCYDGGKPRAFSYTIDPVPSDGPHSLTLAAINRPSLVGCSASLSFKLKDKERSVQSPVVVDP